jgi:hypothetical protein
VAISKDEGKTWRIKRLPVELPHEADRKRGTLGYATVRQAPNGTVHLLATMTHPCLHYEFNEAWVFSDGAEAAPEKAGGRIEEYRESYPDGSLRARWSARICAQGRYLLEGRETTYYQNGRKEYEASYVAGRKTGAETFWGPDGTKLWAWQHDPKASESVWTQYWSNGGKRLESRWHTQVEARDIGRKFLGLAADGPAYHWNADGSPARGYQFTNGVYAGTAALPVAQVRDEKRKGEL